MLHYDHQHVSSSTLFILRRTNCFTTASGIVTLCKQPYSMQVESGLQSAQYVCYTTIFNMFRAARCSSSGGQIVSPQPLVSSTSVNSRILCRWRADLQSAFHLHTVRLFTEGKDTRGCGDTICPPEDEQRVARNMLRIVV